MHSHPANDGERHVGGFDAAAERFDDDERGNRVLAHMRQRVWEQMSGAFPRGARLLELGSGTGTDAARLALELECRVALVDVAPRLLERAAGKVRGVGPAHLLGAHVMPARDIVKLVDVYGRGSFDGAYSNFGALNCEGDLSLVADGLSVLLKPGAQVVLSVINRFCPAEVAWYLAHGDWQGASRRWRGPIQAAAYPDGPKDVTTWYYSRGSLERSFAAHFRVEHAQALPLLWPPPYLDFLVDRFGPVFRSLEPLERWVANRRGFRDLGDHFLVRLTRR